MVEILPRKEQDMTDIDEILLQLSGAAQNEIINLLDVSNEQTSH